MHTSFRSLLKYISTPVLIVSEVGFLTVVVWLFANDYKLFLPISGLVYMLLMVTPRLLYRYTRLKKFVQRDVIHLLEIIACLMAILNGLGALSFYRTMTYYDTAIHFTGALGGGMIVALLLGAGFKTAGNYTLQRLRFFSILITVIFLFLWEAFEYVGDMLFHTSMLGQEGEPYDTLYDIIAGVLAMILLYNLTRSVIHRYFYGKYPKRKSRLIKRARHS